VVAAGEVIEPSTGVGGRIAVKQVSWYPESVTGVCHPIDEHAHETLPISQP
jgi:hypothetical protein